MAHTKTYWKLDGYRHLFEQNGRPRRIVHEGIAANVQTFCYNRDAAQSDELHRRFWVGSIDELLRKVGAQGDADVDGRGQNREAEAGRHFSRKAGRLKREAAPEASG
jgi:hypothetical protein